MPSLNESYFDDGFPIFFEGVELARHTYFIDVLGLYGTIPDISEEASVWLWRFTICAGKGRMDKSINIIRSVDQYLKLIGRDANNVIERMSRRYAAIGLSDKVDVKDLLDEWLQTFQIIKRIAKTKDTCSWIGVQ